MATEEAAAVAQQENKKTLLTMISVRQRFRKKNPVAPSELAARIELAKKIHEEKQVKEKEISVEQRMLYIKRPTWAFYYHKKQNRPTRVYGVCGNNRHYRICYLDRPLPPLPQQQQQQQNVKNKAGEGGEGVEGGGAEKAKKKEGREEKEEAVLQSQIRHSVAYARDLVAIDIWSAQDIELIQQCAHPGVFLDPCGFLCTILLNDSQEMDDAFTAMLARLVFGKKEEEGEEEKEKKKKEENAGENHPNDNNKPEKEEGEEDEGGDGGDSGS